MPASCDVFLSNTVWDKPAVRRIAEALVDDGLSVWLDEWNLVPGESWVDAIADAITHSRSALVVVGGGGGLYQVPILPFEIKVMH